MAATGRPFRVTTTTSRFAALRLVSQVQVERVQDGDRVNAAEASQLSESSWLDDDLEHGRILPFRLL
jgi:hypothetical protein